MTWVINASPLTVLGKINQLPLLDVLSDKVIVPQSVMNEIMMGMQQDSSVPAIMNWASRRTMPDIDIPSSILGWDLGQGETQVLSYAYSKQLGAILDDGAARAAAKSYRIPIVGSLGIILRARQNNHIPAARSLIEQLLAQGSYLSDELIEQALHKVGE